MQIRVSPRLICHFKCSSCLLPFREKARHIVKDIDRHRKSEMFWSMALNTSEINKCMLAPRLQYETGPLTVYASIRDLVISKSPVILP